MLSSDSKTTAGTSDAANPLVRRRRGLRNVFLARVAVVAVLAGGFVCFCPTTERDLAELAVLMRRHACLHPGAQFREPLAVAELLLLLQQARALLLRLDSLRDHVDAQGCGHPNDGGGDPLAVRRPILALPVGVAGLTLAQAGQPRAAGQVAAASRPSRLVEST